MENEAKASTTAAKEFCCRVCWKKTDKKSPAQTKLRGGSAVKNLPLPPQKEWLP